ncbi:MAG: hypothetical protein ACE145_01545 [Terriglobia bacterium]
MFLILVYVAGVITRHQYGIAVDVRNESSTILRGFSVKVESRGKRYPLPDLEPGKITRVYVDPVTESSINLEFTDAQNEHHSDVLAGYVESGYCGTVTARVLVDNKVISKDDSFRILYWKSWLEFLT